MLLYVITMWNIQSGSLNIFCFDDLETIFKFIARDIIVRARTIHNEEEFNASTQECQERLHTMAVANSILNGHDRNVLSYKGLS